MTLFRPQTGAGEACLGSLITLILLLAGYAFVMIVQLLTGCAFNGAEVCLVGGFDIQEPITVLAMFCLTTSVFAGPFLLVITLVTGLRCALRRVW